MILILDHYDSFTYNLAQYIAELGETVEVVRYDAITLEEIRKKSPHAIILSPGPGHPKDYVTTQQFIHELHNEFPILGICLGHQLLGQYFGGTIIPAHQIFHGKRSQLIDIHNGEECGMVMRYHSLAVDATTLPDELEAVSYAQEDHTLMEMRHKTLPIMSMQYHPESIGTPDGHERLQNFFKGVSRNEIIC